MYESDDLSTCVYVHLRPKMLYADSAGLQTLAQKGPDPLTLNTLISN